MRFVMGCGILLAGCALTAGADLARRAAIPLDRVSSGGLLRLDRNGDLVRPPAPLRQKLEVEAGVAAGLDARVGPGVRVGGDPPALPANMRAQAEPHLALHPLRPDFLLGTFQEGRFTTGGAVNCGYGVSTNGGISWSRSLVPKLTTNTGGVYLRATDPVAGIDLDGNLFLNNLAALDAGFNTSALLISRSTNGGDSFEPPVEIARSPDSTVFLDKNWMAINTFSNTPTAGRIVSTFTRFEASGHPIALSYSDNQGRTWSPWKYVTRPSPFFAQGSQPVFLPGGELAVVYWNFGWNQQPFESIEVAVSTNGGASFTYSNRVAVVTRYDALYIRDGSFLVSASGNRTNNSIYVAYQAIHAGVPRILFTMSPDAGRTWSAPRPISDNPASAPVFNPAIAVSADGQTIGVLFCDQRANRGNVYAVDVFFARSSDAGATWQPNLRVTSVSSDARRAPLTGEGYMLGDYQGLVLPEQNEQAFVGIYIDTRTGSPDPFSSRIGALGGFAGWRTARFSIAELSTGQGAQQADLDLDGASNALEYALGQDPRAPDHTALRAGLYTDAGTRLLSVAYERPVAVSDAQFQWSSSSDLTNWTVTVPFSESASAGTNVHLERVTTVFPLSNATNRFFRLNATVSGE